MRGMVRNGTLMGEEWRIEAKRERERERERESARGGQRKKEVEN